MTKADPTRQNVGTGILSVERKPCPVPAGFETSQKRACDHRRTRCSGMETTCRATKLGDGEKPGAENLSSLDQAKPEARPTFGFFSPLSK